MFLEDPIAASGAQFVHLGVVDLVLCRDTGVSDEPLRKPGNFNCLSLCHPAFSGPF
jgi:hypothetical protein